MNIGVIIGRIGGVDGVALETEKWIAVLEKMGHNVFIIAGQFENKKINPDKETLVPEMSFFSPESYWGQKKAFHFPEINTGDLIEHIHFYGEIISKKIIAWANDRKLDILISENASALPAHLELGLGIKKAVQALGIPTITHDHDFAWERGSRYVSPHQAINEFVEEHFPLRLPNVIHAAINLHGKHTIKEKYNRQSIVVPNVMDFSESFGEKNEVNQHLYRDLCLAPDSVLLFQVTRIVRRKGIEVAINLIDKLQDQRVKLIISGSAADDEGSLYYNELIEQIHQLKLGRQVLFASHIISNKGHKDTDTSKQYSLSDAYANAVATTYFSTYEGFGNAFVESILAKTPIFVNNYKPVYWPDIGSKGFKTVMLEDNNLSDKAVADMHEIIFNPSLNKEVGEYNYDLGKKYFSYDTLEQKLQELIDICKKM